MIYDHLCVGPARARPATVEIKKSEKQKKIFGFKHTGILKEKNPEIALHISFVKKTIIKASAKVTLTNTHRATFFCSRLI